MRVILANSTCKVGGVSTFLLSLRAELARLGHTCELFFFERGPMEAYLPADDGIHFGTLADLMRLVDQQGAKVVHANNVDWPTGISAVRRLGAKLVLTAHKVREPAWTYGWTRRNCDAFVTVSHWIKEGLQPFTDARIQVVHNGIDTRRFTPEAARVEEGGAPIVAWIGRGSAPRKRLEAFAAASARLRHAGVRIWVIDQQGPDQFAARCPAEARVLRSAAERWDGVPFEAMPAFYREVATSGGCVISTASMEGLPLTLLEAQACGCPVIAADVQGVNECVLPEHGGTLYPFSLPEEDLAALILDSIGDRAGMRARGQHAAALVARAFSLAAMAEHYVSIYRAAPLGAAAVALARRYRHAPLVHWGAYLDERLGVGHVQYAASRALARSGDIASAAAAAREALSTAPTMYAAPERMAHLLKVSLLAGGRGGSPRPRSA